MTEDERIEELRKAAHDAPLAKIYQDHKGNKFIGEHSDAWWKSSREWMNAKAEQERKKSVLEE